MKTENEIVAAIQKTIFITPATAKKKNCLCYGAPSTEDEDGPLTPSGVFVKTINPCIATGCMNWVNLGRVGFCLRAAPSGVLKSAFGSDSAL
jgi:hypothetical protein